MTLLTLLLPAVCLAAGAPITLSTDRPCNLFSAATTVKITARAPGLKSLSWSLAGLDWKAPPGTLDLVNGAGGMNFDGLPRGYYEFTCTAPDASANLAFGVVADHSAQDPPSGRLNVDAALSWLTAKDNFEPLAQALRMVGIGWVRERFAWGDTEREKGKVDWKQYDLSADTYARWGIRVYQIFHDSPGWVRGNNEKTRNPEDLREVYQFTKRLAQHFKGRVQAWEVWNEPDIGFWPDLGDTFAGVQKAAYLGFKAGDPDLPVLSGSWCRGVCAFDENLLESGIADYFDIFNWHLYAPPEVYPGALRQYLDLLGKYHCADRPVWMSEAGIGLHATQPNVELSPSQERTQAEFVPRSLAFSLAAGTDRHFFFVYPYYPENGVQFGALRQDLSPRPSFIAIAAAAELLGEARYLGRLKTPGEGVIALAFAARGTRVLVIWSDKPQTVELSNVDADAQVADLFGAARPAAVADGKLKLQVGPAAQYVIGLDEGIAAGLTGEVRPPGKLPTNHPCPLVVRGQAKGAHFNKDSNRYLVGPEPFAYTVEVCNLSETRGAEGEVAVQVPAGWTCAPAGAKVALAPMGRATFDFTLTAATSALGLQKVWVRPTFPGLSPQPSVSYFALEAQRLKTTASRDLNLGDPAAWVKNISGNGAMDITASPDGGVRFAINFTAPGDRWCYPQVKYPTPQDFSAYQGIAFEYRCHDNDDETMVRMQLWKPNGSAYIGPGWPARRNWTPAVLSFEDLSWGNWSPADPEAKFDPAHVAGLMIGLNTPHSAVSLEVRKVCLVRF